MVEKAKRPKARSRAANEGALKTRVARQLELMMGLRGLSQRELAEALGVTQSRVSTILSGDVNFTLRSLHRVARALKCDVVLSIVTEKEGHR